jgi:hypothetical protein
MNDVRVAASVALTGSASASSRSAAVASSAFLVA